MAEYDVHWVACDLPGCPVKTDDLAKQRAFLHLEASIASTGESVTGVYCTVEHAASALLRLTRPPEVPPALIAQVAITLFRDDGQPPDATDTAALAHLESHGYLPPPRIVLGTP